MKYSLFALSLLACCAAVSHAADLGNVAFIGDSITHGVQNGSYRFDFWKILADNGTDHRFVGVNSGNYNFSGSLTYKGQTFNNVHSAGSSWRTYQTSGDYMNNGHKNGMGPNTLPAGGYINNWLGISDSRTYDKVPGGTLSQGQYLNGSGAVTNYTGKTMTGNDTPDTFFIMLGTNDMYSDGLLKNGYETTFNSLKNIVEAGRQANPNANFVILSMPSIASKAGTETGNVVTPEYNSYVQSRLGELQDASGNSNVSYADINKGITTSTGYLHTGMCLADKVHPNEQGNLIIAGNLAKAMGLTQRTAGLERKEAGQLASQVNLTTKTPVITTTKPDGSISSAVFTANNPAAYSVSASGTGLVFAKANGATASSISSMWQAGTQFTVSLSLKMAAKGDLNNYFTVWLGNGVANDGFLKVYEDRIEWGYTGSTVLYVADMTTDFSNLTISYLDGSSGAAAGYYVWLGDQLIGEAKTTGGVSGKTNRLLLGAFTSGQACYGEMAFVSFDTLHAYAPIPEPTTAVLGLAGCFVFCLRRRRVA